jgi:hypothetical protein
VGKIGARIDREKLPQISVLVDAAGSLPVFHYEIDQFLKLDDEDIRSHVIAACSIVQSLMRLGLGLSQCSKVLHTVYPRIMPMIDSMLQEEYRRHIDSQWTPERPEQILLAYYMNLKAEPTANSLDCLFSTVSANVPCLTKVRVFDIVWWSYLRATRLSERHHITWKTV